jgi:hypothetical protein
MTMKASVTANPTTEWIARQNTDVFPWNETPAHLIRDRAGSYGHAVTRRLTAMSGGWVVGKANQGQIESADLWDAA